MIDPNYIARLVAAAPPLTDEQVEVAARILSGLDADHEVRDAA